jgi:hypothetical protein
MRRLVPVLTLLVACRSTVDDETATGLVATADSGTDTDTETGTETETGAASVAEQCTSVCDGYAACGCADRCQTWCDSYLEWTICNAEIEALIACATTHPSPCTWGDESQPNVACWTEIQAFSGCSGNVFFPLPGVPQVCDPG